MYFDLNVPVPTPASSSSALNTSKKGKGKAQQTQSNTQPAVAFSPAQIIALEARIDLLIHLGYTVLALSQTVHKRVEPKTFVNTLDALLGSGNNRNTGKGQLKAREGIVLLKRLTIVLDEDSEKGFGLTNANASLFTPYDLIALLPTTESSFSNACLTHSLPSPLTAHIISLPLTLPRLPFRLKHTVIRTTLRNGAVFEINYAGALGGESDISSGSELRGGGGAAAKRNWWAGAREVVRVTKGKSGTIILSGGVANDADLRAPRDVGNLVTFLGLAQNDAHDAETKAPRSLVLQAQTRKTYRAVFSEPEVVIPGVIPIDCNPSAQTLAPTLVATSTTTSAPINPISTPISVVASASTPSKGQGNGNGRKRLWEELEAERVGSSEAVMKTTAALDAVGQKSGERQEEGQRKKKKKGKDKGTGAGK